MFSPGYIDIIQIIAFLHLFKFSKKVQPAMSNDHDNITHCPNYITQQKETKKITGYMRLGKLCSESDSNLRLGTGTQLERQNRGGITFSTWSSVVTELVTNTNK